MPRLFSHSHAIYQLFDTKDGEQVFVGVVSDGQWKTLCNAFGLEHLLEDPDSVENRDQVVHKDRFLPEIEAAFKALTKVELMGKIEHLGLPFAPIGKPEDMFDDPHLNASGGLFDMVLEDGRQAKLPALPVALNGERIGLRHNPPKVGEHTDEVLREAGLSDAQIISMRADRLAG